MFKLTGRRHIPYLPLPGSSSSTSNSPSPSDHPRSFSSSSKPGASRSRRNLLLSSLALIAFLFVVVRWRSHVRAQQARLHREEEAHNAWLWEHQPWKLPPSFFPEVRQAPDERWPPATVFAEPIQALKQSPPPSSYACDDRTHADGPLLLVGIFTMAHKRAMRDTIRRYQFPSFDATDGIPKGSVELKFVVGRPRPSVQKGNATGHGHGHGHGEEGEQGVLRMLEQLQRENEQYGDLVVLDHMLENGDDGKTWNWFQYVANRKEPPPRFAMKADDDTFLILPNVLDSLSQFDCSKNIYWGNSWNCAKVFGFHFGGLAYALSWPLVKWIGSADMRHQDIDGNEDARTGSWLRNLDFEKEPLTHVDYKILMGSWDFPEIVRIGTDTLALHTMKEEKIWIEQSEKIRNLWSQAGKPYVWSGGDDWAAAHLGNGSSLSGGRKSDIAPDSSSASASRSASASAPGSAGGGYGWMGLSAPWGEGGWGSLW